MCNLYFIIRNGTSERVVDYSGKPILVEEDALENTMIRFANVLRCHPGDLNAVTPTKYFERYLLPVAEARAKVLKGLESKEE